METDVVDFFLALLSFVVSAPRAYGLKVSNAYRSISTEAGISPREYERMDQAMVTQVYGLRRAQR